MNLVELLDAQAAERPDATAIVTSRLGVDTTLSFSELTRASCGYAACLAENGIGAGDALVVFVPMSPELYVLLSAIWRLGAVALFLDPSADRAHLKRCAEMMPPKAFVGTRRAQMLRATSPTLRAIPTAFVAGRRFPGAVTLDASRAFDAPSAACESTSPALVTFTSGSTGTPKAILRTHGFLVAQYEVLAHELELQSGDIDLATLPVFALANLAAGVTTVIPDADLRRPGSVAAGPVVRQCERLGVTRCTASPALLERIVGYCARHSTQLGVQHVHTGGAPVFPSVLDGLARFAPDASVHAVYGSTEAEPIAKVSIGDITEGDWQRMRSGGGLLAGAPVPQVKVRVLDAPFDLPLGCLTRDEFDAISAPPGVAGGIAVSGPHVVQGYLGGVGDAETKFEVDALRWHRTGDAGYLDAHGRLWLLGRESSLVSDEKGELWPFSVEAAISGFPGLARAALVHCRSMRIVVVQPQTRAELDLDALRERLAWAQLDRLLPVRIIPVDKRHNAKVDYPALHRLVEEQLG